MYRPTRAVCPAELTEAVPTIAPPADLSSYVIGPDVGPPLVRPSQAYVYWQSPPDALA
jgi:hypothetical protein